MIGIFTILRTIMSTDTKQWGREEREVERQYQSATGAEEVGGEEGYPPSPTALPITFLFFL